MSVCYATDVTIRRWLTICDFCVTWLIFMHLSYVLNKSSIVAFAYAIDCTSDDHCDGDLVCTGSGSSAVCQRTLELCVAVSISGTFCRDIVPWRTRTRNSTHKCGTSWPGHRRKHVFFLFGYIISGCGSDSHCDGANEICVNPNTNSAVCRSTFLNEKLGNASLVYLLTHYSTV